MFVLEPLVLAGSTDEAGVGNHPPHSRGHDLRPHLHIGPRGHDDQLPAINYGPLLNPRLCVRA